MIFMSRIRTILLIVILAIIGLWVLLITAIPLSGLIDSGCHDEIGYEGIYFFSKPLLLTAIGKENQRIHEYDSKNFTACPASLRTYNPTRFEIGWLSVYITIIILLLIVRVMYRRGAFIPTV